jgi:hypothetical protein
MINRIVAAASVAALLAAAPASAQDGHSSAVGPSAGIAALGLTAALLRGHAAPPLVYPAPTVFYPAPPVVSAPPAAAEPTLPDMHP